MISVLFPKPCEDGFYGQGCKKECPVCFNMIGPCEKSYGNCSCSSGYQGYRCLDDCALERYGPQCKMVCGCPVDELCHQINGLCLDISKGKFSLIVMDSIEELSDRVRRRDIKRGLERLMELYFEVDSSSDDQVREEVVKVPFYP